MELATIVIASFALLAFHGGRADACCKTLTLSTGVYFTDAPVTNAESETIAVACSLNYVATGGSGSGTCTSTSNGGNSCSWYWGGSPNGILQCTKGCLAPSLTQGVEYVSGSWNTSYLSGTTISLKCSANYGFKLGSSTGSCSSGTSFKWTWASGKQLECDPACPAPVLTSGVEYVSGRLPEYTLGDVITLRCSSGYVSTGGGVSATCLSSNTWEWNGTGMLQCTEGCLAPSLTQGVEYESGDTTTSYLMGSTLILKCSVKYGYKSGSYNGTCGDALRWIWDTGKQLECDPACHAPMLSIGIELASGYFSEYALNDTITLRCSSGYTSTGGGTSAVCSSGNTWLWNELGILQCTPVCSLPTLPSGVQFVSSTTATYIIGSTISVKCILDYGYFSGSYNATCGNNNIWDWTLLGQLQCLPTCLPPAAGAYAMISPSFSKAIYLLNETIQYQCVDDYVPRSGSSSGTCSSINRWTWQTGTTASLSCVIAPPYKGRIGDVFKPAICGSYVIRSTPTSATCLISCLNDGYCRGYLFDGTVCYMDRPLFEAVSDSSINCFARQ